MKFIKSVCTAACTVIALSGYSPPSWSSQTRLWGTYHGGNVQDGGEGAKKVAVDRNGFVYVVGATHSANGIVKPNAFDSNKAAANASSGYLSKFDPNGKLVWSTYYGDEVPLPDADLSPEAELIDVKLDGHGNIYVAGNIKCPSAELATPGAFQGNCAGVEDIYLAKFDPSGQRVWGTYYGGPAHDEVSALSVTTTGVYVAGETYSSQGVAVAPSADSSLGGEKDALAVKFDLSGKKLWARYYGGEAGEEMGDVACYPSADFQTDICYLAGSTASKNDVATPGAHDTILSGSSDGFIARLSGNDGARHWGTYYGGQSYDGFFSVAVDRKLNVYAAGDTTSPGEIAAPDAFKSLMGGMSDNFLVKFDANGMQLAATYFGEDMLLDEDHVYDLAIDTKGGVYALGHARVSGGGVGSQASPGAYDTTLAGESSDFIITKFNPALERVWATYYGGSGYDNGLGGIAVERFNVYVVGSTNSSDAMATPGGHKTMLGFIDAFIAKFAQ